MVFVFLFGFHFFKNKQFVLPLVNRLNRSVRSNSVLLVGAIANDLPSSILFLQSL